VRPEDVALMDALLAESIAAGDAQMEAEQAVSRWESAQSQARRRYDTARATIEYTLNRLRDEMSGRISSLPTREVSDLIARLSAKGEKPC